MLTLFTTPKPLDNAANRVAFCNAVRSWQRIVPTPQILVFGGDRQIVEGEGAQCVPIMNPATPNGHPFFNEFVRTAESLAVNEVMMYVTDHLILTYDVSPTIELISARFPGPFVLTGRRWDINWVTPLNFTIFTWADDFRQHVVHHGKYQSVGTKDYVAFRKPYPLDIPPFIVGYPWYDTWAIVAAQQAGIPVIDASRTIFAMHQNHQFREGTIRDREDTPETQRNAELAAGMANLGHTTSAAYMTTAFDVMSRERFRKEETAQ